MSLRETAQKGFCAAVRWTGVPFVVRKVVAATRVSILLYHDPSPDVVRRHLRYLAPRYSFVSLTRVVDAISSGEWASLPRYPLVLTFDDGHRGNAALRGLFEEYGVMPTIYLTSHVVGTTRHFWFLEVPNPEELKPLPSAERRARMAEAHNFGQEMLFPEDDRHALTHGELAGLVTCVEFGAHTRFHPVLTSCADEECEEEIVGSKDDVERMTGRECYHFSYPNGDYTTREIELVKSAGFRSARTVDWGWNGPDSDPFRLRVFWVPDDASVNRLATDISGISGYVSYATRGMFDGRRTPLSCPAQEPPQ